jgi:hypothetical protein
MATDSDTSLPLLSFPAILRNPGITSRYAHLHDTKPQGDTYRSHQTPTTSFNKNRRDQNEGKRWVRRKDNGQFIAAKRINTYSDHPFANS